MILHITSEIPGQSQLPDLAHPAALDHIHHKMITEYGKDKCEMCRGTFSITNPDNSTIKSCHGVSHTFAYCCQYAYGDDKIINGNIMEEVTKIATYGAALLDKFGMDTICTKKFPTFHHDPHPLPRDDSPGPGMTALACVGVGL